VVVFSTEQIIFAVVFAIIFLFITLNEDKKLIILLLGVCIISGFGYFLIEAFSLEDVFSHIDWEVILILFAMSLLVEALIELRVFDYLSLRILVFAKGSVTSLYIILFLITLFISSLLDNITAIILMGRLTISICNGLNINPKGFVLSEIFATELAGITTPVSSLPSIIVGAEGNLTFVDFLIVNGPLLVLLLPVSIIWFYYFQINRPEMKLEDLEEKIYTTIDLVLIDFGFIVDRKRTVYYSVFIINIMVIGFILIGILPDDFPNVSIAYIALTCALILILITGLKIETLISKVHWESIVFFIGLFLLVGVLEQSLFIHSVSIFIIEVSQGNIALLGFIITAITAPLSSLVDNIPTTAAMAPIILEVARSDPTISINSLHFLWFILLGSVTFGAGFTPLGTATAIIGLGLLKSEGIIINLKEYLKNIAVLSLIFLVVSFFYYVIFYGFLF
jgi:Na+/H+ antiporter NhaD/arsenite permease-like protein